MDIIKQKGYRLTRQRMIILEELSKVKSHPPADKLYQMVRKRVENISFGTVYRNLRILKELDLISELNFGENFSRYDANPENHQHFVCTKCGQVYDIDKRIQVNYEGATVHEREIQINDFSLEFYGICHKCK
ncbi:MAG: transcriptional repressor [candidate division Zixibacteria bacterium]|nr:transcriptional repressor [candidate division Zixibacteria bacterium]